MSTTRNDDPIAYHQLSFGMLWSSSASPGYGLDPDVGGQMKGQPIPEEPVGLGFIAWQLS